MCGIFGFTGYSEEQHENAINALNTLSHRGPDQWNEFIHKQVYLGHRRLSILDLSENGKQPMVDRTESVVLTINGEIYNYKEIKRKLEIKYNFKSSSDSEVVLYGYIEWGIEKLLDMLDGMFAICIYDISKNVIILARDRAGIKPLFYSHLNNELSWSSEIKAIRKLHTNLELDYTAIYDFFTYQYIPAPKTMYKSVRKLEPSSYLTYSISNNSIEIKKYWKLEVGNKNNDPGEVYSTIRRLTEESVSSHMMSDVPVGFFLSGGLDSSTIVGSSVKYNKNISTFTIGFTNDPMDETHFAKIVADHFNTEHHVKILDPGLFNILHNRITEWYDEPFADLSCIPSYLVSELAADEVTVVLTGDGGDEVFGGYKWYNRFRLWERFNLKSLRCGRYLVLPLKKINTSLYRKLELIFLDEFEAYTRLMGGMLKKEKSELRKKWNIPDDYDDYWYFRKYYRPELPTLTRMQYLDFHTYLPDDILTKVDRVSMAVSIECRVPFLSRSIVEFMFSIPEHIRYSNNELKGAMKIAFKEILPQSIIKREKKGFSIPAAKWKKDVRKNYKNRLYRIADENFHLL